MQQGGQGAAGDGDLPTSLPSYVPAAQGVSTGMAFAYPVMGLAGVKPEDNAAQRQWKAPTPFVQASKAASAAQTGQAAAMRFQEAAFAEDKPALKLGRQDAAPTSQISAAQFAASTGGLAMDTALLARVSGTDPAMMGSEEIKQIMRTPDLLSIYQKLQEEDDRRQRRLERNRASARVRREKKKGMVETYEAEVSKLESSLNLLKAHSFGAGQAQELASALDYNPGEHQRHAQMSKEAKMELMGRILGQHSQNTAAIRRANTENQLLMAAASDNSETSRQLRAMLGLTEEQCRQLQNLAPLARDEARKLDAIRKCFSALRAHDWLYVPGIETILHQTRNTMTQQQFQKFLSWCVENRPSIEQLHFLQTANPPESEKDLTFIFSED